MVRPSSLVISEIAIIKENNKAKQQKINECSTKNAAITKQSG